MMYSLPSKSGQAEGPGAASACCAPREPPLEVTVSWATLPIAHVVFCLVGALVFVIRKTVAVAEFR